MPFTPAHAAAVLPLRRLGLPLSALIAGSVVPDAPLYLVRDWYAVTHTWWGVLTIDVALALAALWLWFAVVRDAYADVTPWVRDRVPARARLTARQWLLVPVGAAIGAVTHVVWDSATHEGRPVAESVPWLAAEHAGIAGAQWAQWASGVLGLAVVATYAVWWLARQPASPRTPRVARPLVWFVGAPVLAVVAGLTALASALVAAHGLHVGVFDAAVAGVRCLVVGAVATAVVWRGVTARSRAPEPSRQAG